MYTHIHIYIYIHTWAHAHMHTRMHAYIDLILFDFGAVGTWTCPKQTPNKIFCIMKGIRILRDNYCPCAPFNIFDHHLNLNLQRYYSWCRFSFRVFSSYRPWGVDSISHYVSSYPILSL